MLSKHYLIIHLNNGKVDVYFQVVDRMLFMMLLAIIYALYIMYIIIMHYILAIIYAF